MKYWIELKHEDVKKVIHVSLLVPTGLAEGTEKVSDFYPMQIKSIKKPKSILFEKALWLFSIAMLVLQLLLFFFSI